MTLFVMGCARHRIPRARTIKAITFIDHPFNAPRGFLNSRMSWSSETYDDRKGLFLETEVMESGAHIGQLHREAWGRNAVLARLSLGVKPGSLRLVRRRCVTSESSIKAPGMKRKGRRNRPAACLWEPRAPLKSPGKPQYAAWAPLRFFFCIQGMSERSLAPVFSMPCFSPAARSAL